MLRPILMALVLLGCSGCIHVEYYQEYSLKVDSLSQELDKAAEHYLSLDTSMIRLQSDSLKRVLAATWPLQDSLRDTILDSLMQVGDRLNDVYETFWLDHPLILHEIRYTRKQLDDLAYDLDNYELEKEAIGTFFDTEKESVIKLTNRMERNMTLIQLNIQRFSDHMPELRYYTDSLQANIEYEK